MTLDPQARDYLAKLASLKIPDFSTMPPPEARRLFQAMRGFGARPDPVAGVENLATPAGIALRLYRPIAAADRPQPAMVYFHGGGWVLGNIETVDNLCRRIANASGCVVVSVDYRLAPEVKFPGPLDDCYESSRFVFEQAGALGIDPDRLAVGGDSAGANLATSVALMARDRSDLSVAFQVLAYPITNHNFETGSYLQNAEGFGLSRSMMIWYWDQFLARPEDGANPLASPLLAENLTGLPPALILTAEHDVLRDDGRAYAHRLVESGVRVEARDYPGMIHGFLQMADTFDLGKQAIADVGQALRIAMRA